MFTTDSLLLAYFSPESYLPITSVVATVIGVLMMMGRTGLRVLLKGLWWRQPGRRAQPSILKGPHTRLRSQTSSRVSKP